MKNTVILSAALGTVCTVASGVLSVANHYTQDARAAAKLEEKSRALVQVLPAFDNQPLEDTAVAELDARAVTFFRARRGDEVVGYAGQGFSDRGFGGRIEVLVGFETDGRLRRIIVTGHTETPGLGSIATDRKAMRSLKDLFGGRDGANTPDSGVPPCTYLDQYEGRMAAADPAFTLDKDGGEIQAVSGATISSRAIADAVTVVTKAFAANRERLTE